jgi:cysteine-S-conjugate beta-lyase
MSYDFDKPVDRAGTDSVKWGHMGLPDSTSAKDVLPLWVADMDFMSAKPIVDALRQRVDRDVFGYTYVGEDFLRSARLWYQRRFGWEVAGEDIHYSPGIVPAIGFLIDILTEPGDGVIIQRPVYHPFANMVENHGRKLVDNALIESGGRYTMDFADLKAKARDPRNKLVILCSPHNPVGRVWTEAELRKFGRICLDAGLVVLSDEIHHDILRQGVRHLPLETLFPEDKAHIVTMTAPSKTFNIAGLQLSNVVIHDPAIAKKWKELVNHRLGLDLPNAFAATAAAAAWDHGEPWLEELKTYLDGNFACLASFLEKRLPKARLSPSQGTYLAWVDFRAYGFEPGELFVFVRDRARVLVNDGAMFGSQGEGFLRLNLACPRARLVEALERIASALLEKKAQ